MSTTHLEETDAQNEQFFMDHNRIQISQDILMEDNSFQEKHEAYDAEARRISNDVAEHLRLYGNRIPMEVPTVVADVTGFPLEAKWGDSPEQMNTMFHASQLYELVQVKLRERLKKMQHDGVHYDLHMDWGKGHERALENSMVITITKVQEPTTMKETIPERRESSGWRSALGKVFGLRKSN